jgi:hypothetical protein
MGPLEICLWLKRYSIGSEGILERRCATNELNEEAHSGSHRPQRKPVIKFHARETKRVSLDAWPIEEVGSTVHRPLSKHGADMGQGSPASVMFSSRKTREI